MSLPDELLRVAHALLTSDGGRPKQAALRRAVSTAYYALFHMLVDESSSMLFSDSKLRFLTSRAYVHTEMKDISRNFLPEKTKNPGPLVFKKQLEQVLTPPVPGELIDVVETFIALQDQRHRADYKNDRQFDFKEHEVHDLIQRVAKAFRDWQTIKGHPAAIAYLASLLLWKRWKFEDA